MPELPAEQEGIWRVPPAATGMIVLPSDARGPCVWPELDDPRTEAAWLRHMKGRTAAERDGMRWGLWFKRGLSGRSKQMTLSAETIGDAAALRISQLMRVADFANLPGELGGFAWDANEYRVTAADGEWHHTVHWADVSAPQPLTDLFTALEGLGTWVAEGPETSSPGVPAEG